MSDGRTGIETRSLASATAAAAPGPSLLVVSGEFARRIPLPASGAVIVGRAPDADITLPDAAVSRYHARFTVRDGLLLVTDHGSHNGTAVNGVRLAREQLIASGDVVSLGETVIVVQASAAASGRMMPEPGWRARLDEEVVRMLAFDRELAVVVLRAPLDDEAALAGALAAELGPVDAVTRLTGALVPAGEVALAALLPERDGPAAAELADHVRRAVPGARAGVATCPGDGVAAPALLAAASARCDGGQDASVAATAAWLAIGERRIIVADPAMERVYALLRRLAGSSLAVLITGETGAGKDAAAYALHAWSARAARPFVAINCAALAESVLESELFGHRKGAFTGALADRAGLFEAADGGTVFLDEIGELSPAAQAKLLRAVETRAITRVGDVAERAVDFRLVAATHVDLDAACDAGRFRRDLYYRIAPAVVEIPPLRTRRGEIAALARAFLPAGGTLGDTALRALVGYAWPGNVRELRAAIELAAVHAGDGAIEPWHLPAKLRDPDPAGDRDGAPPDADADADHDDAATTGLGRPRPVAEELARLEAQRMREALAACGGVQARAARLLEMPRRTFTLKMRRYGLRDG